MTEVAEQYVVTFDGEGAGEAELSWGQKENWATIAATGSWLPLGGIKPLAPEASIEEVAEELSYLMGRYQPLRTLVRLGPEGRPMQVVHGSGQISLEIVDAGDEDPAHVAEAVYERYGSTSLDFFAEWPLRMGVIRRHGQLTHMAVLMSHFATDAAGAAVMLTEVAVRGSEPVTGLQPLAQAAWQQSPAGQRQNAAALRYWEGIFRTIDPHRFNEQRGDQSPRYWHGEFTAPVLAPAIRAIAQGSGLGASTVSLALFAVAVEQVIGINPVVIRPIVSNRFRPGLAGVLCTVAQAGLCVLDVDGISFDEALRRAQQTVVRAYKYSYFDHEDMVALRSRIEAERGVELDTRIFLNDRREPDGPSKEQSALALREAVEAAAPSEFRWVLSQDSPSFESLFVHIDDVSGAVRVSFHLDSRCVSLAEAEAVAHAMEALARAAVNRS